ncbi:hypothetical protein ACT4UT_26325 [Bacillus sp. B-TM1]
MYHSTQDEKITQCLQRLGLGAELQQTQPHYEPIEKPKRVRTSSSTNAAQKHFHSQPVLIAQQAN